MARALHVSVRAIGYSPGGEPCGPKVVLMGAGGIGAGNPQQRPIWRYGVAHAGRRALRGVRVRAGHCPLRHEPRKRKVPGWTRPARPGDANQPKQMEYEMGAYRGSITSSARQWIATENPSLRSSRRTGVAQNGLEGESSAWNSRCEQRNPTPKCPQTSSANVQQSSPRPAGRRQCVDKSLRTAKSHTHASS